MKTTTRELLVQLDGKDLNKLTNEVRETIFIEASIEPNTKHFTRAELWRIQKLKRPVQLKRH